MFSKFKLKFGTNKKQTVQVQAQLKKANLKIIDQHIKHCVKQAFAEGCGDEKVDEIIELLDKYAK